MNQYDDDDPEGIQDPNQQQDRTVTVSRRQLNQLEKKAKDAEARAAAAERSLAFATAGIDMSDAKMKYFVNGYDGEVKADDIKKAAIEAGFLTEEKPTEAPAPEQTPPLTPEQIHQAQLQAAQQAQLQQDGQAFAQIAAATQQQDTSGINQRAEMEKILRNGGDAFTLAEWMKNQPGMYVAEQD